MMLCDFFKSVLALLLITVYPVSLSAEQLLVNTGTTENIISRNKARLYFSQRLTHWPDGKSITLVVLSDDDPLHIEFSKKVLGLYPYQLRRAWDRQLFTGTGQAPITVSSEQEAREVIAATPGSLSYVSGDIQNEKIRQMEVK
ncbi:MAG: hypothetical protein HOM14_18570 [Gammaproteobacteria bacterium]|nr:hypothetical protein [Gammaproteobacteria bacterium]MBT3723360.1 hypothetical protein [Gammaproteobacteria bacterium]MBT4075204.1 hypothetical protein [Gammaproteobacteria bacterium]MBT4193829.1 hypothetical protein [Gammaproteobacteria bacterium]MBT4449373.1 hypothetical protein [Gammaproteobacteria bacterium]